VGTHTLGLTGGFLQPGISNFCFWDFCFSTHFHARRLFFNNLSEMRILGRIAFPLFCFMIVQGAIHTKSKGKYI